MISMAVFVEVSLMVLCFLSYVESIHRADSQMKRIPTRVLVQFSPEESTNSGPSIQQIGRTTTSNTTIDTQQTNFIAALKTNGLRGSVSHSYSNLFNGVALNLEDENDLNTLKTLPGVQEVFPVRTYRLNPLLSARTRSLLNEAASSAIFKQTAHQLTGVDIIHRNHPNITGNGIKVGVLDSGIDYLHPAFSIPGKKCTAFKGKECRVQFGKDFVGDKYDGEKFDTPQEDADPLDTCNGHGTHVAGIIGGNDSKVKGVAQGVVFGAYRIFGCSGTTSDDIIIAALEAANRDKMQIINMSLGSGVVENSHPITQVVDKLSKSGVIIISAAGNEGEDGYSTVSAPGVAKLGISAASYDNSQSYETYLKATGAPGLDLVSFRYSSSEGITARFNESVPFKLVPSPQLTADSGDGCTKFKADTFKNSVALMFASGACNFTDMVPNAVNNGGATGVIIYNRLPGDFSGKLEAAKSNFPAVFVSGEDGEILAKAAAKAGSVTVTFDNKEKVQPFKNAGRPSLFSSLGLDLSLLMKPDIGAPGGHIISSYPRALGSYVEESGTSMASPYLAGVAALEMQRSGGKTKFLDLQRRLHVTAKPTMSKDTAFRGKALSVAKTGAGLVDVPKFLFSPIVIKPSKLELGDGNQAKKKTIKVTNNGSQSRTYKISHLASESFKAVGGLPQHLIKKDPLSADLAFNVSTITIAPRKSVSFAVTISSKPSAPHIIQSGFIKLDNPADPNGSLTIPYVRMTGDYSKLPLIGTRFPPALYPGNIVNDETLPPLGKTGLPTFDLKSKATSLALVFTSLFPVRRLDVLLVTADKKTPVGFIDSLSYSQPFSGNLFALEGTVISPKDRTTKIPVRSGSYKILIRLVLPRSLTPVPNVDAALVTVYESQLFKVAR